MLRRISTVAVLRLTRRARPGDVGHRCARGSLRFPSACGRRVGLITNRGVDWRTAPTADVLRQAGAKQGGGPQLVALFSPEHGLDAVAEGKIASGRDQAYRSAGIPPLWRDRRAHAPPMWPASMRWSSTCRMSAARYYTYPTTMAYAGGRGRQQARFFVLDRPDPITAEYGAGRGARCDLTPFITYCRSGATRHDAGRAGATVERRNSAPGCMS